MRIAIPLITLGLFLMFYLFHDRKKWLNCEYKNTTRQLIIVMGSIVLFLTLLTSKPVFTMDYLGESYDIYSKYLVDSIINEKLEIDITPDEKLQELKNPYDIYERVENEVEYSFDTAYYNNKYYVYFGVVPALLLFVPFKLITGNYLSIIVGTSIFVILSIIVNVLLTMEIYKKWFKDISFNFLILFILGNLISGLYIWNTWRIWVYELTLISGFFFIQLGIFLILKATDEKITENKRLIYIFTSCLSMALAVGCRPTLALSSALMLPFLYNLIKRKKQKNSN